MKIICFQVSDELFNFLNEKSIQKSKLIKSILTEHLEKEYGVKFNEKVK